MKIQVQNYKVEKKFLLLTLLGGIFLICILSENIKKSYGIAIINDEFGYWGIAATWAGKDWSELLASTPYYSFGYSVLITPLFFLFSDSAALYQAALWINVIFYVISYYLTFLCGKKIFPTLSDTLLLVIGFCITVYSNNIMQCQVAWTEAPLYCIYWLLLYLLIKILEKPNYGVICIYALLNVYQYYIHQRTLGVLLSAIIVFFLLFFCKKISIKQLGVFIGVVTLTFIGGNVLKKDIVDSLFTSKELVAMNDYSGQASRLKELFTSFEGIVQFLVSIIGKLYYLAASTFLLGLIALIMLGKRAIGDSIKILFNRFKEVSKETIIYIYIFMSYCAVFLIAAISMSWPAGRLDILIYGRYMEFAIGPILLCGIVWLLSRKIKLEYLLGCFCSVIAMAWLVNYVYVRLDTDAYNGICISVLGYFFQNMQQVPGIAYWIIVVCIGLALGIWLISGINIENGLKNIVVLGILAYCWINLSNNVGLDRLQVSIGANICSVCTDIRSLPCEYSIFVIQDENNSNQYSKYIQYNLPDKTVHLINADELGKIENEKNAIIISCDNAIVESQVPFSCKIFEKNSWITVFTAEKNVELITEWNENQWLK